MPEKLTGDALIEFAKDNQHLSRDELIAQSGYVKTKKGKQGVCRAEYHQAIAAAMGVPIGAPVGHKRKPTGRLKVTSKGTLPVGAPYTRLLGLEIGDYVQAKYVDGSLILTAWQDEVPFDGTEEATLEITETCSYMPQQCAVG
ncbi:MAG: hypothetical protein CMO47_00625 [Verrucomicrobiales bacterium]|nr:hypothetical protein [Verrucomicrobiales bacterium]